MSFVFYKEVSFKGTPIGNIPQDWEVAKITKLFDLYKGTTPINKTEVATKNCRNSFDS